MTSKLTTVLASRKFFYAVVGVLVLQAAWIALSGLYPMAFDEDWHLGIIRLYAGHGTPFWAGQPPGAEQFGAVFRDPSYLYHYIFSFPYRLVAFFIHNQATQVIVLRFINITLFASSLFLFRRLLLKAGTSRAAVHGLLFLFVFIPVVPLLAAQINYDNLLLPLTALSLLLAMQVADEMRRFKRINVKVLAWLCIICLLASLVKVVFLTIFAAIVIYLGFQVYKHIGIGRKLRLTFSFGVSLVSKRVQVVLLILLILSAGLFIERYGLNLVRYHTPLPDCAQVLSTQECSQYGPWERDHQYSLEAKHAELNPLVYMKTWLAAMWVRLFFAVDGPTTDFQTRGPLTLPALSAVIAFAGGAVCLVIGYVRGMRLKYPITFLLLVSFTYLTVLWLEGYASYRHTGHPVALNGRYLLPVMLLVILPLVSSFQNVLADRVSLKKWLFIGVAAGFLWGGGVGTYIIRSNDDWLWPQPAVRAVNEKVRDILTPVVPGANRPTQLLNLTS